MTKDKQLRRDIMILREAIGATLELSNLKPFVSEMQMDAADRISKHLGNISKIMEDAQDDS
jgi:hypothetical protein